MSINFKLNEVTEHPLSGVAPLAAAQNLSGEDTDFQVEKSVLGESRERPYRTNLHRFAVASREAATTGVDRIDQLDAIVEPRAV
ncbi:hypothetical protein [Paraburkholderia atlantica]|uniref:hypothetical protein n=1 Tax=Paraburkholderia atlantica TaxID=2654982 RepID=UPI001609404B|nr:hypothetical protein [Paraburkholderia atlantica]MBB5510853.1 hypothetical protein [Paraburkholderia atlantica]